MLFVQISDTHVRPPGRLAYRRVDTARALERCVAALNALDPRPEFVLVTGDMVDFGADAEYAHFRELMAPLRIPFFMVLGNHDERGALRRAFPDHAHLFGGEFVHYVLDRPPLRLIGLDSTVPGAPHGELCAERMRWLEERLDEAPNRPTVLFMHHPPFVTGIRHMDVQNLRNGAALGAVVARHRQVLALLCGHVHRFVCTGWHGVTASICPSPSHAVTLDLHPDGPPAFALEPPAYLLHEWTEAGLVSQIAYIGDFEGPHPFFDGGALIE